MGGRTCNLEDTPPYINLSRTIVTGVRHFLHCGIFYTAAFFTLPCYESFLTFLGMNLSDPVPKWEDSDDGTSLGGNLQESYSAGAQGTYGNYATKGRSRFRPRIDYILLLGLIRPQPTPPGGPSRNATINVLGV